MKANLMLMWMLLPIISWSNIDDGVFHQGSFISAKNEAIAQGKIQLLEFVAEWCTPCKHMDQTTFKNQEVQALLEEKFVSVKVDIDQFDGFALKEEFAVRFLPTIVLIDHEGNMIGKIEEALGPTALIDRLNSLTDGYSLPASNTKTSPKASHQPTSLPSQKPRIEAPASPVRPELPTTEASTSPEKETVQHEILQFGVFGSVDNAKKLYNKIVSFLPSEPEIKTIESNGKTLYKVLYGPFKIHEQAVEMKSELSSHGIDSIIKPIE